jgi:CRP-like cAMP-binding protein
MSNNVKNFKRGETIFKEGDKITSIFLIQQGGAQLCIQKNKKVIEYFKLGPGQMIGEPGAIGAPTHTLSAVATTDTAVFEVPVEVAKSAVEASPQMIKTMIKSFGDKLRLAIAELKNYRTEKDGIPCPEDQVARIYGTVFHSARHKGTKDEKDANRYSIDWLTMKQYAQRVFGDSPSRMEQAICVLVKLKLAQFEMGRPPEDPEGPEQIMKVHFIDLPAVESFFEFYQYYYFKGGKGELLKPDENAITMLGNLIKVAEPITPDRFGVVAMDFQKVIEAFKQNFNLDLKADHFVRLEQKGLFAKRQSRTDGTVVLSFELKEFQTTQKIWRILKEIEKWNEKGFVDMTEEDPKKAKKTDEASCPQCQAKIIAQSKFCSECGFKLAA